MKKALKTFWHLSELLQKIHEKQGNKKTDCRRQMTQLLIAERDKSHLSFQYLLNTFGAFYTFQLELACFPRID